MTRKLQFLFTALLLVVGVTSAWAGDITPTKEVNYRPKSDKSGFDSSTPKEASETNNKFEVNHNARFFALQQYTVENLEYVKSLRLTLRAASSMAINELAVWIYNSNTLPTTTTSETATATATALFDAYKAVTGVDLGATGTNTTTSLLKDAATGNSTDGDVKTAYFDITGDALTALKAAASSGTFTLLITNKTDHVNGNSNQKREYYTSGHATEALRPTLTPEYYVYNATAGTTHNNLNDAVTSATDADTELRLYGDVALTGRITWSKTHTLTINPMVDNITIKRGSNAQRNAWFLTNTGSTTILTLGNASHRLYIDGGNTNTYGAVFQPENNSTMNITNVTIQNFPFSSETDGESKTYPGYAIYHKAGYLNLDDVAIKDCTSNQVGFIKSEDGSDSRIKLLTGFDFNNCTGAPCFYIKKRMQISPDDAVITIPTPLTIDWYGATAIGTNVVVKVNSSIKEKFELTKVNSAAADNYGLIWVSGGNDLKITQAYTLSLGEAGAATLVLPFESTIPTTPSGLTCYKLIYDGGVNITATAEKSTLGAGKPVLVIGTANTDYKFVSTATSGEAATGSDQPSYGVLIGNYDASYPVPTYSGDYVNYILQNKTSGNGLGFYKSLGTNTIAANRAYMSVKKGTPKNAPAFFGLNFNGMNGTTGISITSREETTRNNDGVVYNLNGVRMNSENLPKGIYVKNGRKFIVK